MRAAKAVAVDSMGGKSHCEFINVGVFMEAASW